MRWSATQEITGPSIAAEPSIASAARTGRLVAKARCVRRRWKPTVTPKPVAAYMIANTITSLQPSSSAHTCQPATPRAMNGRIVTRPVMIRSRVSFWTGCTSAAVGGR